MTTTEREFFRTQRDAGIQWTPWADSAELQRAAGWFLGVLFVGFTAACVMALFGGLLRWLAGGA